MEYHPISNIFPLMEGNEFDDLCHDIAANGLIEPIWTYDGMILDGRNRQRACDLVGIKPQYREYSGDNPLQFVTSMNVRRRHLNESQRAMIAARLANMGWGGDRKSTPISQENQVANLPLEPISQERAAEMLNISSRSLRSAKQILETASPEVVAEIDAGNLAVSQYARRYTRQEKIQKISEGNKPLNGNGKRYSIILADPPWQYEHPLSDSREIENQYPTLSLDEIKVIPIDTILSEQAILFLWCPAPLIEHGLDVMKSWSFEYRTNMVWVKSSIGAGQWVRQRHELLLIGRKGEFPTPEGSNRPDSVIEAPREEHSKKPDIVYDIIDKMYPELERIELFARQKHENWDSWGNEL
jgi:N6-adenosine-specific RNA methylase IME4